MRSSEPPADRAVSNRSIWTGSRSASEADATVADIVRHVRRRFLFLVAWVMAFCASAVVYVKMLQPDFIATTQILLQPQVVVNDGPENLRHFYQLVIDSDQCETELRILNSQRLLYQVFKAQNLADAPEIRAGADGVWSFLGNRLDRLQRNSVENAQSIEAFNGFVSRMRARRLGLSYVIEISYRAHTAEQASKVANAIASTYAAYRLRGILAREQPRGVYRESRLSSLKAQIAAAEEGSRSGIIPDNALPDSDVRLLGPASRAIGVVYPKMMTLVMMMAGFGLVSGLLIILLSRRTRVRYTERIAASASSYTA